MNMHSYQNVELDVYKAVAAIEKMCMAAGYNLGDLMELEGIIEGSTATLEDIRETLDSTITDSTPELVRQRLNDPTARILLSDLKAVRDLVKSAPLNGSESGEKIKGIIRLAITGVRMDLSDKEIDDEAFSWGLALE